MKFTVSVMFVGMACWAGSAAHAQKTESESETMFKQLDSNGDGKLSTDEIGDDRKRFFERLVRIGDSDKDGQLTKEEFLKGTEDAAPVEQDRFDRSRRGFRGGDANQLMRFDKDGDGALTREEIPEPMREGLERLFETLGKDKLTADDLRGMRGGRFSGRPPQDTGAMFERFDADKNDKLSAEELPDWLQTRAKSVLEENGKNGLTREEFGRLMTPQFGRRRPDGRPEAGNSSNMPAESPSREEAMRGERDMSRPRFGNRFPSPAFFEKLDTDKDGNLTRDELSKAAEQFDALDANKNGQLEVRELMGFSESGRREFGSRGPQRERRPNRPSRPEPAEKPE